MEEKDFTLRDGKWVQRTYAQPTPQQQLILNTATNSEGEINPEVLEVFKEIQKTQFIAASKEDAARLQEIYDANYLAGSDHIDVDITLPDGRGIINCRSGLEHKQIRF
jgi:hypothetical protein